MNIFAISKPATSQPPVVSSVSPTVGAPGGGYTITITGTGFSNAGGVMLGTSPCAFVVVSSTQITATVPAHAVGAVDVSVSGAGGTSILSSGFSYWSPDSISGLTLWLDATSVTQGGGIVTAMHNKGSTLVDPVITPGAEPTYSASNANYGNRPTWKCSTGAARRITAAAPCHGLAAAPYTIVMVGQCGDSNYAVGTGNGSYVAGGGGSGNKWQGIFSSSWLVSSSGVTNSPSVMILVVNGASSKIYVNAKTATSGTMGAGQSLAADTVYVGNHDASSTTLNQNGDTTHFLMYNGALSQADCEAILVGLGAESGITIGA